MLLALVLLPSAMAAATAQTGIGVVMLHGKRGVTAYMSDLQTALQGAGYLVETPELCWSNRRIYDRPFLDCLAEIDAPVARLVSRGARGVVILGYSLGGMAAIGYGARRQNLLGVIALAPGGGPERMIVVPQIAASVGEARAMLAAGRGDERTAFKDHSLAEALDVRATASAYLSFFAPEGPANMLANAGRLRAPLLWVAGNADPSQTGPGDGFDRVPANPLNRYVKIDANHLNTPDAARGAVLGWLREIK